MRKFLKKSIPYSFGLMLFLVPLVFYPFTSEVFEFNKMVVVYLFTALISLLWIARMATQGKIIFRRTILDVPIIIFLTTEFISTILSLDFRTSLLGYYSRFHGGLISYICYSILYWAFVSNINKKSLKTPLTFLFLATLITAIWGILEHYGHSFSCLLVPDFNTFDVSCWIQDVQTRVYATFGQPNWMASFLIALVPITWYSAIKNPELKKRKYWLSIILSIIIYAAILSTKSRSGIVALALSDIVFWFFCFYSGVKNKQIFSKVLKTFLVSQSFLFIITIYLGTPWTPDISGLIQQKPQEETTQTTKAQGPALEVGGTESGKIREIVWKGALDIWKNYPIFGSGVETFAYSYYKFRPIEHNLTSEWDYLYNKAHNEYLNFAATTGSVGLIAYLSLIAFSILLIFKPSPSLLQVKNKERNNNLVKSILSTFNSTDNATFLKYALFSGYLAILITNFFGFSVVATALLFFLFPAIAVTADKEDVDSEKETAVHFSFMQKLTLTASLIISLLLIRAIINYWRADYLYSKGKMNNDAGNYSTARSYLVDAIKLSRNESVFWDDLAKSTASIAILANKEEQSQLVDELLKNFEFESSQALSLSPVNVNIKRNQAALFIQLSTIKPQYLLTAKNLLIEAVNLAPTEAKLLYNLAIAYARTGEPEKAITTMKKTVSYKPDYRDAYFALSLIYIDNGEKDKAKESLEYIIKNINPNDVPAQRQLEEIQS